MKLKNIDPKSKIRLFINKVEMDFSTDFTFYQHPINFSSMTFNDVIPKDKNKYPDFLKIDSYTEDFSIAEVYSGNKLIFFGIVNSSGRLDLFKSTPKTKTIEISDFRKWLSLKKPVEKIFLNKSPEDIVIAIIEGMEESKIKIGNLSFSNNDNIKAYSSESKTPYQVLKETIAAQTNSLLYFKIEDDGSISINYKSNDDIKNNVSEITLNLDDVDSLKKYKITEITMESNIDNYTNYVKFDSENIISNIATNENFLIEGQETFLLLNKIGAVNNNIKECYILRKNGTKIKLVILTEDLAKTGKYYDVKYKVDSNEISVNSKYLNQENQLFFSYFQKKRTALELKNESQINLIASLSTTKGDVYHYEKYNDISSYNDLLKQAKNTLDYNSSLKKIITITSDYPIWEVADAVNVISKDEKVNGIYLVHSVNGSIKASSLKNSENNNFWLGNYTYSLQNTNNVDTYMNQFDNQSFRDNSVYDENSIVITAETLNIEANIIFNYEIQTEEKNQNNLGLEQPLKTIFVNTIYSNDFKDYQYIYIDNN